MTVAIVIVNSYRWRMTPPMHEKLKAIRKHRKLSQHRLAVELECHVQTVSDWELQKATPQLHFEKKIDAMYVETQQSLKVEKEN